MILTVTSSKYTDQNLQILLEYMEQLLPKIKKLPGVKAVYHSIRKDKHDETTFIVWENSEAITNYRNSPLFKEIMDWEAEHHFNVERQSFPVD